jgi:hypothetical protein
MSDHSKSVRLTSVIFIGRVHHVARPCASGGTRAD